MSASWESAPSPACGAGTTLDIGRSFEIVAGCPLAGIDRALVNQRAVAGCRIAGDGLFTRALKRQLRRRAIDVRVLEHDLIAEMRGLEQRWFACAPFSDGGDDVGRDCS